jgi:hypothetical protein
MGIILYEACTGQLPFNAESLFDLLRMHLETTPRPPRQLRPDLPPEMEAVILKALAKDPAHRFSSAVEMAEALFASAQGLPQSAWATLGTTSAIASVGGPTTGLGMSQKIPKTATGVSSDQPPQPRKGKGGMIAAIVGAVAVLGAGGAAAVVLMGKKTDPTGVGTGTVTTTAAGLVTTAAGSGPASTPGSEASSENPWNWENGEKPPTGDPTTAAEAPEEPPTAPEPPASGERPALDKFSLEQGLAYSYRRVREIDPSADLVMISISGIFDGPSGMIDLKSGQGGIAIYQFRSPGKTDGNCIVQVMFNPAMGEYIAEAPGDCNRVIVGRPKCKSTEVLRKRKGKGSLTYTDVNGTGQWVGSVNESTVMIQDDC